MIIFFTKKAVRLITVVFLIFTFVIALQNGKWLLKKIYPMHYEESILKYAQEYNVDPYLIAAIMKNESRFNPKALSPKEAKGLMQIAPITGKWAAEKLPIENYAEEMLYDPDLNIKIACWYLNILHKEFDGDIELVIPAYNAGNGNVKKWLQNNELSSDGKTLDKIPFEETRFYLQRVLKDYKTYQKLYK